MWQPDKPKSEEFTDQSRAFARFNELGRQGYTVGYNNPYPGLYVVTYYRPGWFKTSGSLSPLEDYFGVRFAPTFVPAIVLVFRHGDYDTLHDRVVEPAVTLARNMGLGVQGPVFLPTASMARSARVLVRGPAEELVRYTQAVELLPRYGAQVDVRLERIVEMVGHRTAARRR